MWRCVVVTGLSICITELRGDNLMEPLVPLIVMTITLTVLEYSFSKAVSDG